MGEASSSISLRLPAGQRIQRKFAPTATLEQVYEWAELSPFLPENVGKGLVVPERFILKAAFPSKNLVEREQTVEALNLAGSSSVRLCYAAMPPQPVSTPQPVAWSLGRRASRLPPPPSPIVEHRCDWRVLESDQTPTCFPQCSCSHGAPVGSDLASTVPLLPHSAPLWCSPVLLCAVLPCAVLPCSAPVCSAPVCSAPLQCSSAVLQQCFFSSAP